MAFRASTTTTWGTYYIICSSDRQATSATVTVEQFPKNPLQPWQLVNENLPDQNVVHARVTLDFRGYAASVAQARRRVWISVAVG